jgi:hypothetical protein
MTKVEAIIRFNLMIYDDMQCQERTYIVIRLSAIGLFGTGMFLCCMNEDKHPRLKDCKQQFLIVCMNEYNRTTRHENGQAGNRTIGHYLNHT